MKKKIATLITGVLLMAIVSAGLVGYFAKITGTITVEGPVFYLDDDPKGLVLNEAPDIDATVYNITNEEVFFIYDVHIDNLYGSTFSVYIPQKSDQNLDNRLNFSIIKYDDGNYEVICSSLGEELSSVFYGKDAICSSDNEINFNPEEKLGLMISDIPENVNSSYIRISTYTKDGTKYPRIQITAT